MKDDWKEFFKNASSYQIVLYRLENGDPVSNGSWIEDIYQAFKSRLIEELEIQSKWLDANTIEKFRIVDGIKEKDSK